VAALMRRAAVREGAGDGEGECDSRPAAEAACVQPAPMPPAVLRATMHYAGAHRGGGLGRGGPAAAAAGGGGGFGLQQHASRHRARFAPESTPEGYWDLDSLPNDSDIAPVPRPLQPPPRRGAEGRGRVVGMGAR